MTTSTGQRHVFTAFGGRRAPAPITTVTNRHYRRRQKSDPRPSHPLSSAKVGAVIDGRTRGGRRNRWAQAPFSRSLLRQPAPCGLAQTSPADRRERSGLEVIGSATSTLTRPARTDGRPRRTRLSTLTWVLGIGVSGIVTQRGRRRSQPAGWRLVVVLIMISVCRSSGRVRTGSGRDGRNRTCWLGGVQWRRTTRYRGADRAASCPR